MENWNQLVDVSLQKIERIFDVPGNVRTPLVKKRTLHTPQAPKKVKKSQIRREGLKPRKLTYENENIKRTDEKSNKVWEDSGITLWATTSSTLRMDDVDKENRPESGKRHKSKGKTRVRSDDRVRDRGRKDDDFKSSFRHFRI
ncbi:PREDICTED: uncharacterized protein LOC105359160 isoform X1 [Ceratosolen solmsi marchali]|uniref:Uncharacterized protein LOC105359160 isoform X1 n=1 Tax=Ceratosolen solmsi marchali TaxID=326594 RepID=A0AAJ6VKE7_9HYME|nr:PREDICTED: uncharacterized protein LOC105359160 isoform X1 [Ceratosolen solmsi marchali]